jgi:hypothetical protein
MTRHGSPPRHRPPPTISTVQRIGSGRWLPCFALVAIAVGPVLTTHAGPPHASSEAAAIDASFREGQQQFDRGEFVAAARSWARTADTLTEDGDGAAHRAALYGYVADAYDRAQRTGVDRTTLDEGLTVLDAYLARHADAHPDKTPPDRIVAVRDALRAAVRAAEDAAKPVRAPAAPPAATAPPPRPPADDRPPAGPTAPPGWRGFAAGGGVALGLGATFSGLAIAGAVQADRSENAYILGDCSQSAPIDGCAELTAHGRAGNRLQIAGLVGAPVFVAAGIALIVLAVQHKASGRSRLSGAFGRSTGIAWHIEF